MAPILFREKPMRSSALTSLFFLVTSVAAGATPKYVDRLEHCADVLRAILEAPDQGIPQELLDRAECVGVIPSTKKGAFGIGGSYGKGAFVCRGNSGKGTWGPPAMYRLTGINFGFQFGGRLTDFVILVMNPRGMKKLIRSKFKIGADASVAAGPKGRTAEAATDALMGAEMLTYSRTQGLFAGVSLEGAVLMQDNKANKLLYGRKIGAREILFQSKVGIPAPAQKLVTLLKKYSPRNISDASESLPAGQRGTQVASLN